MSKLADNLSQDKRQEPVSELERELAALARAEHGDAFRLLGPHAVERGGERRIVVRAMQPHAASVSVLVNGEVIPGERIETGGPSGIFEVLLPSAYQKLEASDYRLRIRWEDATVTRSAGRVCLPARADAISTCICWEKDRIGRATTSWARTCARWTACKACSSRYGRRMRCA